jgi:hypothetical protein
MTSLILVFTISSCCLRGEGAALGVLRREEEGTAIRVELRFREPSSLSIASSSAFRALMSLIRVLL